jgi:hypothetical protein
VVLRDLRDRLGRAGEGGVLPGTCWAVESRYARWCRVAFTAGPLTWGALALLSTVHLSLGGGEVCGQSVLCERGGAASDESGKRDQAPRCSWGAGRMRGVCGV